MRAVALFLLAGSAIHFDIADARGKKASGITIEATAPDADGWYDLNIAKGKGDPALIWPFDGRAKVPDGPEHVPAIVIQRSDEKALMNLRVAAAIAVPIVMGLATLEVAAKKTGLTAPALNHAFATLESSNDHFEKGVGFLFAKKGPEAAEQLGLALKDRQRQLTRVPSEIYPAAMLYGFALALAEKFDAAAVAFLTASQQRPSDVCAVRARAEALTRAGKSDAAESLLSSITGKSCQYMRR
jgi:hypothetical protein